MPRLFVLCGLSRLTVRVAHALHGQGGDVVVLRRTEGADLLPALGDCARVVEVGGEDYADALRSIQADTARAILALSEEDGDNFRALAAAREAAPDVPLVLRTFDPALADVAEAQMGVRRAFSVSALAAPGFLAAAAGGDVPETLRLGDADVPLCRLTVTPNSPLMGLTAAGCKARTGCAVLARARMGEWKPITDGGEPLQAGDNVLLGGLQTDVLRACVGNAGWREPGRRAARPVRQKTPRAASSSRLPGVAALLGIVLALSVFIFGRALRLPFVDALYFVVTTATTTGYGDISLKDSPAWVKLFGCAVMLTGGALLGIVFSYLAAQATAERLDEDMGRRAGRMSGHIVLAGLGTVGFRIARQLAELGLPFVVIEQADTRFAADIRAHAPVLSGDARLPETLERANIGDARILIACTDSDVANIGACLHARRRSPHLMTVARIFDDALAGPGAATFGISRTVSASGFAASAFVSAALDENAVRVVRVGALELRAARLVLSSALTLSAVALWREQGVRVLAFRVGNTARRPSELTGPLSAGDELIVCGPADMVDVLLAGGNLSHPRVSE